MHAGGTLQQHINTDIVQRFTGSIYLAFILAPNCFHLLNLFNIGYFPHAIF